MTLAQESADDRALLFRLNLDMKKQMRNAKGGDNMANPTYEVHANDAASEASVTQFNIDRAHPGDRKSVV